MDTFFAFFKDVWPTHMYFAVQILAAEMMFAAFHEKRSRPALRFSFGIVFYLLISWFHPMVGIWFVRVLFIFGWSFLLLLFCIKASGRKCFFICLASYAIQNLAYNTGDFLSSVLGLSKGTAPFYLFTFLVFVVVYVLCGLFTVKRLMEYGDVLIKNLTSFILAIGTLIVVLSKNALVSLGWLTTGQLLSLFTGVSCVLILTIQFSVLKQDRIEKEKYMIEHLLNAEKETFERLKENINIINMKCHDLRYHISAYQQGASQETHDEFFQNIERSIMIYDNTALTGNAALDVLLSDRLLYCTTNHIEISYIIDTDVLAHMSKADIYSFFGNAMDNAIQCVMKYQPEKRFISLSVKRSASLGYIVISNYCEEPPAMEDGLPVSEGDPNYHGFGIRTIKYIAEKYGGELLVHTADKMFTLSVLFPKLP